MKMVHKPYPFLELADGFAKQQKATAEHHAL